MTDSIRNKGNADISTVTNRAGNRRGMAKPFSKLKFKDDYMFCKVMELNPDICKQVLEMILDVKIREIHFKGKQVVVDPLPDRRYIRLDVLLDDEAGTVYDLEMQTQDKKDLPLRSRSYQGTMDMSTMGPGMRFKDLTNSFIIFICTFDPFKEGLCKYTFREQCIEKSGLELGDGTSKVFVNAKSKQMDIQDELKGFLDYVCGKAPSTELTEKIESAVISIKGNPEWETEYISMKNLLAEEHEEALKEGIEIGAEKGREEAKCEVVDSLISEMGMSVEQACHVSKIPVEQYYAYKESQQDQAF